ARAARPPVARRAVARPAAPHSSVPRFEDYPVARVFEGRPARPIFLRNRDKLKEKDKSFRVKVAQGLANGPNFAGHYSVVEWGCGRDCVEFVIADTMTGRLFYHSGSIFSPLMIPEQGAASGRPYAGLEYRLDSGLLIADGCSESAN